MLRCFCGGLTPPSCSCQASPMAKPKPIFRRGLQVGLICLSVFAFLGAGDNSARFNNLGHRLMCVCGCNYVLLECNHVGCPYSDRNA